MPIWLAGSLLSANLALAGQVSGQFVLSATTIDQADILVIKRAGYSYQYPFKVYFGKKKYIAYSVGEAPPAVYIGIAYNLKPGKYLLKVSDGDKNYFTEVEVREKFPPKKYIVPSRPPEKQNVINSQAEEFWDIFRRYERRPLFSERFCLPIAPAIITENGRFGDDRCSGRKIPSIRCRYHLGTDFRAAFDERRRKPEKIVAINSGKVVAVRDYFSMGKVIVIDHGAGIFSGYLHLSKFSVREGERVKRGQVIGIAGNTGTDAIHLHLFIRMNNGRAIVDPEKFLNLFVSR